jgi:hypothetical protein
MSQKVWVINAPKKTGRPNSTDPVKPPAPATPTEPQLSRASSGSKRNPVRTGTSTPTARTRWLRLARAYLLGPIALALWPRVQIRAAWSIAGAATVVAAVLLIVGWTPFTAWIDSVRFGLPIWFAVVSIVFLAAATVWSRAVAKAGRDHPILASVSPRWLGHPRTVCALGLLVPGLGLMIAGHPRRAACVLWMLGPLAVAVVVLAHWRWLVERSRSAVPAGISDFSLEIILIAAVGVAALMLLNWIVQALDGARRVSTAGHSHVFADAISIALLASIALFSTTFRPVPFARSLGVVSVALHRDGLRVIPLGLAEAAARLDPASPGYLAHAALLNDELGMTDAARAKRYVIERRMQEYTTLVQRESEAARWKYAFSSVDDLSPAGGNELASKDTWSRVRALPHGEPAEQ